MSERRSRSSSHTGCCRTTPIVLPESARVEDRSVQAVWSFDVFVHVAPVDQAGYLSEIARVLSPGGVAVIHHANGRNRGSLPSRHGWRSPMTAGLFGALAREHDLDVVGSSTAGPPARPRRLQ